MLLCPKCDLECPTKAYLIKHYRHEHTDYDNLLKKEDKELKQCHGLTRMQKNLYAKDSVRTKIRKEINTAINEAIQQ